jgi:hypothetical protein
MRLFQRTWMLSLPSIATALEPMPIPDDLQAVLNGRLSAPAGL